MNGWLILAGAVALWLLLRRRKPSRAVPQSRGPQFWFEFEDASGDQKAGWCSTELQARAAARSYGGRYIGRFDTSLGRGR